MAVTTNGAVGALFSSFTVEDTTERLVPTSLIATTETGPETFPGTPVMAHASVSVTQENSTADLPCRKATKVARYDVIFEPFDAAGSHETFKMFVKFGDGTTFKDVGAAGTKATGVTAAVGADAGPVPMAFVAVTTNV